MRTADYLQPSRDARLGATADGRGVHFAVFSEYAEKIDLCLFDINGRHETRLPMAGCINGVWHGYLAGAQPGLKYGYRVYGPYDPKRGLRFNGNKLLLDPYARQLSGDIKWHDSLYGYRIGARNADLVFDRRDSAAHMPKAIVTHDNFDWGNDYAPRTAWSDTIIYEMHVRGFTRLRNDLPEHDRGTFGALGHATTIDYLKRLGITAVELLPVHAFARDRYLLDKNLTNYWGYNTLAYFSPDCAYLSDGTLGQIKWAVRQLHLAGIEVILDVVYNHTCEGNELGPTLSWRGFDNCNYYRLLPNDPRYYINDTGCGNTLNTTHPRVIQLILDSLRYWVQEFHVDGFRFDLGVTLGREPTGFDPGCGLFDAMLQDPVLSRVKLISEPWDIGPGGFQVGNHPPGFAEWNSQYRDTLRAYWRGDHGMRGSLAGSLQGSAHLFDHQRRHPWSSINFVTAHDGFTLQDLISYDKKHNEANGEDNRDGNDNNISHNWGCEGATDNPGIRAQREKIARAFFASLMVAHGTPMLLAGDEFGQTQHGNNNAYCHDDELSWLNWALLEGEGVDSEQARSRRDFVAQVIALRKQLPTLRAEYYRHDTADIFPGLKPVTWFDERGIELCEADWNNGLARVLGLRRCEIDTNDQNSVQFVIALFNADSAEHEFVLPHPAVDFHCSLYTDFSLATDTLPNPGGANNVIKVNEPTKITERACVAAHSLMLLSASMSLQQLEELIRIQDDAAQDNAQQDEVEHEEVEYDAEDAEIEIDSPQNSADESQDVSVEQATSVEPA